MTVSFFSEAAHHPTTLWVSISRAAYTHTLIEETGRFSFALLNRTQKDVALHCGTVSGKEQDKYARLKFNGKLGGVPYLHGALASTECAVRNAESLGDHTIFVADILQSHFDPRRGHLRHLLLSDL